MWVSVFLDLEHLKIETRLITEMFANVMGDECENSLSSHGCCLTVVVYYESIKWKLKIKCICECRCYERLQTKTKEFTRLTYTGLVVELEHLKIETRLIDEMCANAMGEYVT